MAAAPPPGPQDSAPGADFWSAIGVSPEPADSKDQLVAPLPAATDQAAAPAPQSEWASLFNAPAAPPEPAVPPAPITPAAPPAPAMPPAPAPPAPEPVADTVVWPSQAAQVSPPTTQPAQPAQTAQPAEPQLVEAKSTVTKPAERRTTEAKPAKAAPKSTASEPTKPKAKQQEPPAKSQPKPAPQKPTPAKATTGDADLSWANAERIADGLRSGLVPRLPEVETDRGQHAAWREMLASHTGGNTDLAGKVYDVLSGWHVLGEAWRDESVEEIHIRGVQVMVTGPDGVREAPGFPDLATARRTAETLVAGQADAAATVTRIGASTVVSRRFRACQDAARLVAAGVITADLLSQVEAAVARVQSVTVTGPAAPAVVRALASLVPAGSRVFEGPFGVLPQGCVATSSPLDADYVIGVRPGVLAEEMAAAGQIGALVANPETQFAAALRLAVSGRTHSPEKVTPW